MEKANRLNEYFVSLSTVDDSNASLSQFTPRSENTLNFIHVEESEIVDVVQTVIVNKASGDDQISHIILTNTRHTIKKPLCILFNRSLRECKFPSAWKY